ncbi:MAG: hypothetical protein ACO1PI_12180 [Bacteroidota bacterium]
MDISVRVFRRQVRRPAAIDRVPNTLSIASGFIPDDLIKQL